MWMLGVAPQLVLLLHNRDLYKTRHITVANYVTHVANYVTQIRKPTKLRSVLGILLPNHRQPPVNVPVYPFANHVSNSRSPVFIKLSTTLLDNSFSWYLLTSINKPNKFVLQIIAVIYSTMRYWFCNWDCVYLLCSMTKSLYTFTFLLVFNPFGTEINAHDLQKASI